MNPLAAIDQIFFDIIKTQTKILSLPPQGDELSIRVGHRLL